MSKLNTDLAAATTAFEKSLLRARWEINNTLRKTIDTSNATQLRFLILGLETGSLLALVDTEFGGENVQMWTARAEKTLTEKARKNHKRVPVFHG